MYLVAFPWFLLCVNKLTYYLDNIAWSSLISEAEEMAMYTIKKGKSHYFYICTRSDYREYAQASLNIMSTRRKMHVALLGQCPSGLHTDNAPGGNHARVDGALWNEFLAAGG